eukprot:1137065-Pelagomonas_calceolata.AAC.2
MKGSAPVTRRAMRQLNLRRQEGGLQQERKDCMICYAGRPARYTRLQQEWKDCMLCYAGRPAHYNAAADTEGLYAVPFREASCYQSAAARAEGARILPDEASQKARSSSLHAALEIKGWMPCPCADSPRMA